MRITNILKKGNSCVSLNFCEIANVGTLTTWSVCEEGYEWDYMYSPITSTQEYSKQLAALLEEGYINT